MEPITPDSPEAQSADLVAENIEKLKALFPEIVTEGADGAAVNVDVLKQLLGDQTVTDASEKYGLNWHGKRAARQLALTPSLGTLRPCPEESKDWDTTQNLFIEGDNLEVLKLLQKSYAGKVKLIYIDPPYNTGKDFVYPDNFRDNIRNYKELTGQVDGEGRAISSNKEASGRFHTDWMNMIYSRLKLARNLLRDDGIIFISIDDNEVTRLRQICEEVFGEENQINPIIHNKLNSKNDTVNVQRNHEYLICYRKTTSYITTDKIKASLENSKTERVEVFKDDDRFYLIKDPITTRGDGGTLNKRKNLGYTVYYNPETTDFSGVQDYDVNLAETSNDESQIYSDKTELIQQGYIKIRPPMVRGKLGAWTWDREKFNNEKDSIIIKQTRNGYAVRKREFVDSLNVVEQDGRYYALHTTVGNSRSIIDYSTNDGSTQLSELLGIDGVFDNPKNVTLIEYLISLVPNDDYIFLDFFSGSASSLNALINRNHSDQGKRKFIGIQLQEETDESSTAFQAGFKTIAEIGKERLRRAAAKIQAENPDYEGDLGFRVFKLDSSNIKEWNAEAIAAAQSDEAQAALLNEQVDHLLADRTEDDILYELLLKLGLDLCVPVETREIAGKTVHAIGGGVLMVCLSEDIKYDDSEPLGQGLLEWHQELAPATEVQCVFRDAGFADDKTKTNLVAILEQNGLKKVRSI